MSILARTAPIVIDWSLPADARTGVRAPLRNPIAPFRKARIESPTLEQLTRIVAAIQDETESVTTSSRALPTSGPVVIYKNVRFGGETVLAHLVAVGKAVTSPNTAPGSPTASFPEQIQYEIFNHVGANALTYRTAIDERTITIHSDTAFTASVRLFVLP